MAAKKILIIDDNKPLHDLFRSFFQKMGYEAETADDGCEGIEKYCRMKPDIVLMDIHMPNMNGYESSAGIKFFDPDAKIIMLTGFPHDPLAEKSLAEGHVLSVLNKPCNLKSLYSTIAGSLSR